MKKSSDSEGNPCPFLMFGGGLGSGSCREKTWNTADATFPSECPTFLSLASKISHLEPILLRGLRAIPLGDSQIRYGNIPFAANLAQPPATTSSRASFSFGHKSGCNHHHNRGLWAPYGDHIFEYAFLLRATILSILYCMYT